MFLKNSFYYVASHNCHSAHFLISKVYFFLKSAASSHAFVLWLVDLDVLRTFDNFSCFFDRNLRKHGKFPRTVASIEYILCDIFAVNWKEEHFGLFIFNLFHPIFHCKTIPNNFSDFSGTGCPCLLVRNFLNICLVTMIRINENGRGLFFAIISSQKMYSGKCFIKPNDILKEGNLSSISTFIRDVVRFR